VIPLLAESGRGPERCIKIVQDKHKLVTAPINAGCALLRKERGFFGPEALSKVLRLLFGSLQKPSRKPNNSNIYISLTIKLVLLPRSSICDTQFPARLAAAAVDVPALLLSPQATAVVYETHTASSTVKQ
jgi:hypothetical protein